MPELPDPIQVIHENHAGVTVEAVGGELRLSVPVTGSIAGGEGGLSLVGDEGVPAAFQVYGTDENGLRGWRASAGAASVVAGASGFQDVSGLVTVDLSGAWVHQLRLTGNVTSLAFANIPEGTVTSAVVRLVIRQDATGGRTVAEPAGLVFRDGREWADLNGNPNATNVLYLERVGGEWFAFLDNGTLELDDYYLSFLAAATIKVVIRRPQVIDVENAAVHGAGTVVYEKNGSVITAATVFEEGDRLEITAAEGQSVTIPRLL